MIRQGLVAGGRWLKLRDAGLRAVEKLREAWVAHALMEQPNTAFLFRTVHLAISRTNRVHNLVPQIMLCCSLAQNGEPDEITRCIARMPSETGPNCQPARSLHRPTDCR